MDKKGEGSVDTLIFEPILWIVFIVIPFLGSILYFAQAYGGDGSTERQKSAVDIALTIEALEAAKGDISFSQEVKSDIELKGNQVSLIDLNKKIIYFNSIIDAASNINDVSLKKGLITFSKEGSDIKAMQSGAFLGNAGSAQKFQCKKGISKTDLASLNIFADPVSFGVSAGSSKEDAAKDELAFAIANNLKSSGYNLKINLSKSSPGEFVEQSRREAAAKETDLLITISFTKDSRPTIALIIPAGDRKEESESIACMIANSLLEKYAATYPRDTPPITDAILASGKTAAVRVEIGGGVDAKNDIGRLIYEGLKKYDETRVK